MILEEQLTVAAAAGRAAGDTGGEEQNALAEWQRERGFIVERGLTVAHSVRGLCFFT